MKKFLLVCLVFIFVIGMVSCGSDEEQTEWKQETLGEITFDIEPDWEKEVQDDQIHTNYYFNDDEQSVLNVAVQPTTDGENSKEVLYAVVQSIEKNNPNYSDFAIEDWEANGIQGVNYTYNIDGEGRKAQVVMTIYDGVAYSLNFLLSEKAVSEYKDVVDHVFSSVKLADGGENPYAGTGGSGTGTTTGSMLEFPSIPYEDLMKSPDTHSGSIVEYEGELLNVIHTDELAEGYLAIDGNQDQILYLTYMKGLASPEPAEGDNIKIRGTSMGIFKNQPWISVSKIER